MVSGHRSRSARLVAAGLIAFLVVTSLLLLGGYLFDWRWTGSRTKKGPKELWDWLTLLLQPFALLLVPLWLRVGSRRTRDWLVFATAAAVTLMVLVFGGYLLHWTWTGFQGNTLWNWLGLFLVPFLLPLVLLFLLHEERHQAGTPEVATPEAATPEAATPEAAPQDGPRRGVSWPVAATAGALVAAVLVAAGVGIGRGNAGKPVPIASPPSTSTSSQRVTVIAQDPYWTDTSLAVRRGDRVRIVAFGRVVAHGRWHPVSPAGGDHPGAKSLLPLVPHAALLATVAPPGEAIPIAHPTGHQPMMVGPHASRTVPRSGELYLGINDKKATDNKGYFAATITVAR